MAFGLALATETLAISRATTTSRLTPARFMLRLLLIEKTSMLVCGEYGKHEYRRQPESRQTPTRLLTKRFCRPWQQGGASFLYAAIEVFILP
jgi:ribosomal protein L33